MPVKANPDSRQDAPVAPRDWYVPDLCGLRALFVTLLVAQLLALVIGLAGSGSVAALGNRLGFVSLLVQLCTLTGAAILCLTRPWLERLPLVAATVWAVALVMASVAVVNELAYQLIGPTSAGHAGFIGRNLLIAAVALGFTLHYFYVQHRWQAQVQAEHAARLQALQARIRPHFLFNCLNTIASLARLDPVAAETAVENLAEVFRASLSDASTRHSLGDELDLCRRYLDIEALRLGERLAVEWQVDELPQATPVPKLLLQPLVENAVYHGIEPSAAGGAISITGSFREGEVRIAVRNPVAAGASSQPGNRMAQDNVRQRLAAAFGRHATLEVVEREGEYLAVLRWPLETST